MLIIIIVTNLNINNYALTLLVNKTTERLSLQFLNVNFFAFWIKSLIKCLCFVCTLHQEEHLW